ncbi:MAG: hypothetical protein IKB34_00280 [Clostridia bacterium]|nr:hypothetical protein [Clostridia bacterium]
MEITKKYLLTDCRGELYHMGDTPPVGKEQIQAAGFSVIEAEVLLSDIQYRYKSDMWSDLCEITTDKGNALWVLAFGWDCALVVARRYLNGQGRADEAPASVKQYDIYGCDKKTAIDAVNSKNMAPLESESYTVGALSEQILGLACDGNRELCALAVGYVNGFSSLEDLKRFEIDCNSYGDVTHPCADRFSELTSELVRKESSHIWSNWMLLEGEKLSIIRMYDTAGKAEEVWEALFWTFFFEAWGGYDSKYPYLLYIGLRDGRLAPFCDGLEKLRGEL